MLHNCISCCATICFLIGYKIEKRSRFSKNSVKTGDLCGVRPKKRYWETEIIQRKVAESAETRKVSKHWKNPLHIFQILERHTYLFLEKCITSTRWIAPERPVSDGEPKFLAKNSAHVMDLHATRGRSTAKISRSATTAVKVRSAWPSMSMGLLWRTKCSSETSPTPNLRRPARVAHPAPIARHPYRSDPTVTP